MSVSRKEKNAYWIPYTANRWYIPNPRLLESAKGMYYTTSTGEKIVLFENISKYVTDKRDDFCVAIINKLINFNFENIFEENFDFYSST